MPECLCVVVTHVGGWGSPNGCECAPPGLLRSVCSSDIGCRCVLGVRVLYAVDLHSSFATVTMRSVELAVLGVAESSSSRLRRHHQVYRTASLLRRLSLSTSRDAQTGRGTPWRVENRIHQIVYVRRGRSTSLKPQQLQDDAHIDSPPAATSAIDAPAATLGLLTLLIHDIDLLVTAPCEELRRHRSFRSIDHLFHIYNPPPAYTAK